MFNHVSNSRLVASVTLTGAAFLALAGCSSTATDAASSSPTASGADTAAPTQTAAPADTATAAAGALVCNETTIKAAIPEASTVKSYKCAKDGDLQFAAVEVAEGPTVFFLQSNGDKWDVSMSDAVCGTASAGWPPELLKFCEFVKTP